jgi:hypothetical protein
MGIRIQIYRYSNIDIMAHPAIDCHKNSCPGKEVKNLPEIRQIITRIFPQAAVIIESAQKEEGITLLLYKRDGDQIWDTANVM